MDTLQLYIMIEPSQNEQRHKHYLTVKPILVQDGPRDNPVCRLWVPIPNE